MNPGPISGCDSLCGFNKICASAKFFQVDHNDFCVGIFMQIVQKIQFIHIRFVANGNKLGKTEIPVRGKIEYRGA